MSERIRVLCVDDHIVVRIGLATIVNQQDDMEIVGHAATGDEALRRFVELRPNVTLMDLRLPGTDGFETTRAIRGIDPQARIVVLTMFAGDEDVRRAIDAGASGYLLKDTLADNLVKVIRDVHAGRLALPGMAGRSSRPAPSVLTAREEDVVRMLGRGMRNKDIAVALRISEETVQAHMRSIFGKLGVHDRTTALAVALRRGIIHMD